VTHIQGPWQQVSTEARNAYALATTLLAVSKWIHRLSSITSSDQQDVGSLDTDLATAVRELDMVLLLSGDPTYTLGPFVQRLHDHFVPPTNTTMPPRFDGALNSSMADDGQGTLQSHKCTTTAQSTNKVSRCGINLSLGTT
jgi:hypothetical protein